MEETALKKKAGREDQAKRSVETRRRRKAAQASSKWSVCVVDVCSSMYWYIQDLLPVCTGMYFSYLKLAFFENRHHHSISLAVELYAVTVCSRRAAGMYEKPSCLVFGTYQYIPVCTVNEFLYSHIPVHTGTYRYIRFCPILSRCTGFQMYDKKYVKYDKKLCTIWQKICKTCSVICEI